MRAPRLNGARGAALLVAGAYCFARGIAYLPVLGDVPTSLPAGLELISAVISIEVWAGIWMIVGIGCVLRAFSTSDAVAWGMLTGIMTAWGGAYALGWFISLWRGEPSREWLNMSTYLGPAIIIAILSIQRARKGSADAPEIASAVPTIVVALIAAIAGIVVAILNRRGTRENALIDQLQEQLTSVEKRVNDSLHRERIRDDYIHELRDHIDTRKPPPPPPWPEGLTR